MGLFSFLHVFFPVCVGVCGCVCVCVCVWVCMRIMMFIIDHDATLDLSKCGFYPSLGVNEQCVGKKTTVQERDFILACSVWFKETSGSCIGWLKPLKFAWSAIICLTMATTSLYLEDADGTKMWCSFCWLIYFFLHNGIKFKKRKCCHALCPISTLYYTVIDNVAFGGLQYVYLLCSGRISSRKDFIYWLNIVQC